MEASYILFDGDLDGPAAAGKWTEWLEGLDNFLVFCDERKTAALLHYAGPAVNALYKTVKVNAANEEGVVKIDQYADVCRKSQRTLARRETATLRSISSDRPLKWRTSRLILMPLA